MSQDLPIESFWIKVWQEYGLVSLGLYFRMVPGYVMCYGQNGREIQLPFDELESGRVNISEERQGGGGGDKERYVLYVSLDR